MSLSLVLTGGDRFVRRVLLLVCCWRAAAENQLPDNIGIERSIDKLVVVDQGDELCSYHCQFRFDGGQAGWYLFKFDLSSGIAEEHLEVLLHTILCTENKRNEEKK